MSNETTRPGGAVPAEAPVQYETKKGCLLWILILFVCAAATVGLGVLAGINR